MEMQSKALKIMIDSTPSSIDRENMTVRHIISTQDIDRDGEIVITKGIDFTDYMKNPVVLSGHDCDDPIGKCISLEVEEGQLIATTQFTKSVQDSVDRFNLIAEGIVVAFSIGFIPTATHVEKIKGCGRKPRRMHDMEDPMENPYEEDDSEMDVRVIDSCILLEYSSVCIPANPNALCKAAKTGNKTALNILKDMNTDESKEALRELRFDDNKRMIDNKLNEFKNHKVYCQKNNKDFSEFEEYLKSLKNLINELIGEDENLAVIEPLETIVKEEPTLETKESQEVESPEVQEDSQELLTELKDYLALSNLKYNASEIKLIGKI